MQRFGPINSKIGHRRLNVLSTRARNQIVVFTSMHPTDIKVTESSRFGVTALRDYLEFADSGKLSIGQRSEHEQGLQAECTDFESVCLEWLKQEGFEAVPEVGVKGYTLDLDVKALAQPQRYLLAIESDGANFRFPSVIRRKKLLHV